jgi:hypothetical protein
MKRVPFFAFSLWLVAGLVACQDQGMVAPNDLQPQFAKGGAKKPSVSSAGARLTGVLEGSAQEGWNWEYTKKEIFQANGPIGVTTVFSEVQLDLDNCLVEPADANAEPLKAALGEGLLGKAAVLRVDMGSSRVVA